MFYIAGLGSLIFVFHGNAMLFSSFRQGNVNTAAYF